MTTSATTNTRSIPHAVAAAIASEQRRSDIAGHSIAAFDRDGVRYSAGFGYADLERGELATQDTLFRAASISKLFTTTLVLRRVEEGLLNLDEPANTYLDIEHQVTDESGKPAPVTIRHLLTHSAGLPISWRGLEMGGRVFSAAINGGRIPRTLAGVVAGTKTVRPPGQRIVYANGGFNLLGYIVQRMAGRPFEDVVYDEVLAPLAMTASSFMADPGQRAGVATAYGKALGGGAGRKSAGVVRVHATPAGGLVTSAIELSRFGRMVLNGGELGGERLLSAESLAEATTFQARNHPQVDDGYGLGFALAEYRGRTLVNHDGGLPGVATRIALSPADGVGVVVLSNGGDPLFPRRVAELMLEDLLGLDPEVIPGSPAGISADQRDAWTAFSARISGPYRPVDFLPPGLIKTVAGLTARPKLSHLGDGVLVLEGLGFQPAYLYPDGDVGCYRLALPMSNGSRVVIEEKADGTHLWASILHLQKR